MLIKPKGSQESKQYLEVSHVIFLKQLKNDVIFSFYTSYNLDVTHLANLHWICILRLIPRYCSECCLLNLGSSFQILINLEGNLALAWNFDWLQNLTNINMIVRRKSNNCCIKVCNFIIEFIRSEYGEYGNQVSIVQPVNSCSQ